MLLFSLFLPLLSTLILLCRANTIGTNGALFVSCLNMLYVLFITWLSFFFFALNGQIYLIYLANWINLYFFKIAWIFLFDNLTFIMLLVVTVISTFVHFYSINYMAADPHLPRFMAYLSLFTFFMLILITANNFLQLFLGWEGVGLCSYLLISFWYTRIQANKSALKALFVNRIGDIALLIAIVIIYFFTYSLDYAIVFLILLQKITSYFIFFNIKVYIIKIICFFLFIGAIGKSAQIGLHMWLPDAMEGPTPVSALIHAATMVTAGVFLIIRCSILFDLSLDILLFIILIGALTAVLAATMGIFQHDIKKIIAYSTCSQLGYMIVACGLSNYIMSLYHLTTHAIFKALLFLSAGAIIHALSDEQDLRKMGGIKNLLPFTYSVVIIGSFALIGFPFLAGFYSKDLILELTFNNFRISGLVIEWLMRCATILTAIYSTRIFYRVFLDLPNGNRMNYLNYQEVNYIMYIVLFFLAIGSLFSGYFLSEIFTGIGNSFFSFVIISHSLNDYFFENELFVWHYKNLPLILSFFGFFSGLIIYYIFDLRSYLFYQKLKYYFIYLIGIKKWFIDILLNELLIRPFLLYSYKYFFLILDRGYLEILGPTGLNYLINFISKKIIKEHNVDLIKYLRVNVLIIIVFFIIFI